MKNLIALSSIKTQPLSDRAIIDRPMPDVFYNNYPLYLLLEKVFSLLFAFGIFSVFLAIILSFWVYIDAQKRQSNHHPLLYALLTLFFWPIGIIIYILTRGPKIKTEPKTNNKNMLKQLRFSYFYLAAFVSLAITAFAFTDLINKLLGVMEINLSSEFTSTDYLMRQASFRLSTFLVIFPLYFFHWKKTLEESLKENKITELKTYIYLVLVLSLISLAISGIRFLFHFNNSLFGVEEMRLTAIGPSLTTVLVSAVIFFYHHRLLKKTSPSKNKSLEGQTNRFSID